MENKKLLPGDEVWAFQFKNADYINGIIAKHHVIAYPMRGIVACEREYRYNEKALKNKDTKVKYFIPYKEGTSEPDWLKAKHIDIGLYFSETERQGYELLNNLIQNATKMYVDEINYLQSFAGCTGKGMSWMSKMSIINDLSDKDGAVIVTDPGNEYRE